MRDTRAPECRCSQVREAAFVLLSFPLSTFYQLAQRRAGEFYTFVRTLEAYKKALGKDTRLILTTDSEFFRLLKEIGSAEGASSPPKSPRAEGR